MEEEYQKSNVVAWIGMEIIADIHGRVLLLPYGSQWRSKPYITAFGPKAFKHRARWKRKFLFLTLNGAETGAFWFLRFVPLLGDEYHLLCTSTSLAPCLYSLQNNTNKWQSQWAYKLPG